MNVSWKIRCMKPIVSAGSFLLERHRSVFTSFKYVGLEAARETGQGDCKWGLSKRDWVPHERSNRDRNLQDPQRFVKLFSPRNSSGSKVAYMICKEVPSVGLPLLVRSFKHCCLQFRVPNDGFDPSPFFWASEKLDVLFEFFFLIYP